MSAENIIDSLKSRAADFRSLNAPVRFQLEDGKVIHVDARESPVAISDIDGDADCTIRISTENLKKLIEGRLNPMMAFTMGKLKVDGSMGLAMKLAQLLDD